MIHIERASIEDAEIIVKIKKNAYTDEDIRFGKGKDECTQYIGDVNFISWCINRYILYKIILDDIVIGTFWLDHETDKRPNHFELQDFCIDPIYQNKGYGAEAIKLMEQKHKDIKIWTLSTFKFSLRNQYLYEKMGYVKIGQDKLGFQYEKYID